ncbi:GNAT family N-acetyltransferase [Evansella halocellulosilytica]|uniref:GNAT family N-acetyltransferase n=1 Tax=Evansella halocellulosilytica TaxID=2011013 RepID=UPI0015CBEEFC|nr:GNAT family N-acetyltransferase [Evansella halocellulosilytica]
MLIRQYEKKDTEQIVNLFRETILTVNYGDYTEKQVEVWANTNSSIEAWEKRLENSITYVGVIDKQVVGFGNYTKNGEIDLFFTHKDYQRQGVGAQLLDCLENSAKSKGDTEILTEASITAKPFFESKGYQVLDKQKKNLKNTEFINFIMKKKLI